jgi:glycerophosphoryl diester phosphodiesterase
MLTASTAIAFLVSSPWLSSTIEGRSPEAESCSIDVCGDILTIAHRGEHLHHPENSLPAIQAAIDAGADFVELDVRTTSDGHLVLMHDRSVDRMTNGSGRVARMTFDQIRELDLGVGFPGQFPGLQVPTFDEALDLARNGGISIYVHTKAAEPAKLVAAIDRQEMGEHVLFFADDDSDPNLLSTVSLLRPAWRLMPEAFNPAHLRDLLEKLRPRFVAFDDRDFDDRTIAVARNAKVDIFVDRLDNDPRAWLDAIRRGATGIQTDYPAELVAFLRPRDAVGTRPSQKPRLAASFLPAN